MTLQSINAAPTPGRPRRFIIIRINNHSNSNSHSNSNNNNSNKGNTSSSSSNNDALTPGRPRRPPAAARCCGARPASYY